MSSYLRIWDQTAANRGGAGLQGRYQYGAPGGSAVVYNPNYYNTQRGQAELNQNRADAVNQQIRDLREQVVRQKQLTQSGTQVLTDQDRADRAELLESAIGGLQAAQPLVAAGLADPTIVQSMMKQSVGSTVGLQRQARQADREAQAVAQMAKNSGSLRQVEGALQKMRQQYSPEVLARSQTYLQLTGMEGPLEEARNAQKLQYAEKLGVDPSAITWDFDNNAPTLNKQEAADQLLVQKQRELPMQQEIERRKIAAGSRPTKPERWRYKSNEIGGQAAADAAYQRDLQIYQKEHTAWVQQVYGGDPRVTSLLNPEAAPSPTAPIGNGEVADPTPQNPEMIEKLVRAGLKPPGVYIGLDGNKYEITGE